jgi:hypothetical protein
LMKAKKPYVPIAPPSPRPTLSITANGEPTMPLECSCADCLQACSSPVVLRAAAACSHHWLGRTVPTALSQRTCRIKLAPLSPE